MGMEYETYSVCGGMPGSYVYDEKEQKQDYVREVYRTIIIRDLVDKYKIRNEAEFKKIIQDINVSNKNTSILANEFNMKKVLYKIMEDYYCQPFVSTGDNFLFEESELFNEFDNGANVIIREDDANLNDKLGKED